MSQDTAPEPAPDNTPPTEPPEAAAEKARKVAERRPQSNRVLQHVKDDIYRMLPEEHASLDAAEAWVGKNAPPGLFWSGRGPKEAQRVNPRAVVPEGLP